MPIPASFRRGTVGTVAAAGAAQGSATLAPYETNLVTAADGAKGVILPAAVPGNSVWVVNNEAAQNLLIYPATGQIIDALTANVAFTLSGGQKVMLRAYSITQWYTVGASTGLSDVELAYLDGVTAGTGAVSKALVLGATTTSVPTIVTTSGGLIAKSTQAAAITTTRVLTTADSGGTFSVAKTSAYAITLPTPAQGVRFKFMVLDTGANAVTISNGSAHLKGLVSVNNTNVAMTGTTLSLASGGSVGDWVEFEGIDATNYLVTGACIAAADITIA